MAVLPTTDVSGHPELAAPMRKALFSGLASLPYNGRDLKTVDAFLSVQAARLKCTPAELKAEAMADPRLADCVVFSQVEEVSRFYLFLYAHLRIDLNMAIVDTRSRRIIYRNRFVFYDRMGMPTISLLGLLENSIFSLWHLRADQIDESLQACARKISENVPQPNLLKQSADGALRLSEAKVSIPHPILTSGNRVDVFVKATPRCRLTYSIGTLARNQSMAETAPGCYRGEYRIRKGENTPYAIIEIKLRDSAGRDCMDYALNETPFAVDTQPPPRARVGRWWRDAGDRGIYLEITLHTWDQLKSKQLPAQFQIFRRAGSEPRFTRVGATREPIYCDADARHDTVNEYYIITLDQAGNAAAPWSVLRIQPQRDED